MDHGWSLFHFTKWLNDHDHDFLVFLHRSRTLSHIMREMIQTERDYVKSLQFIIENYIPEVMRDDIPQSLRGKRNVIFGNLEKIYEFHSQFFLSELEQIERRPFHICYCFLQHVRLVTHD